MLIFFYLGTDERLIFIVLRIVSVLCTHFFNRERKGSIPDYGSLVSAHRCTNVRGFVAKEVYSACVLSSLLSARVQ
jgi:hypothetical protein